MKEGFNSNYDEILCKYTVRVNILKGCICDTLVELKEFGGYGHYNSTYEAMENNANNGYFEKIWKNEYEMKYQCNFCGDVWIIGIPDFPVKGYFSRKAMA